MVTYTQRKDKNLFSCDELCGIEMNGGEDDDFGDEMMRNLPYPLR